MRSPEKNTNPAQKDFALFLFMLTMGLITGSLLNQSDSNFQATTPNKVKEAPVPPKPDSYFSSSLEQALNQLQTPEPQPVPTPAGKQDAYDRRPARQQPNSTSTPEYQRYRR